jgi:hypothetical protein
MVWRLRNTRGRPNLPALGLSVPGNRQQLKDSGFWRMVLDRLFKPKKVTKFLRSFGWVLVVLIELNAG